MSGIGAVGGSSPQLNLVQQNKTEQKPVETASSEPQDKVEIQKDISAPRKFIERVIGAPVGLVTGSANLVGGVISGGISGVTGEAREAKSSQGFTSGLAYVAGGATAGTMLGGPMGGVVGGVGGLVIAGLSAMSGSSEKIGKRVGEVAQKSVSDFEPSSSKVKDTTARFFEGAVVGSAVGGVEGFKEGTTYGAGIVSGFIEGTKGFVGTLAGNYETPTQETKPEGEKPSVGKRVMDAVISAPRNLSKLVVGTAGGVVGAARELADGAIQGAIVGGGDHEKADAGAHRFITTAQTVIAGGATGFAVGGPVGALVGVGAGLVGSLILNKIEKRTDSDDELTKGLTDAVKYAQKDNTYTGTVDEYGHRDKTVYETFRDGIEGVMTGTGAGIREGFKQGYQAGSGVVDGVFDAVKGIGKGVVGGVAGLGGGTNDGN